MPASRVVVDGSNIATEGRSLPSLVQLDEAVRAYREDHPDDEIIVVVDATFAHRIAESERPMFEEAAAHNELVYPPAGAVGRGDAFLLRVAEKTGAVVLSNDSFQEFHGEHDWLFEKGRLVGGTPVPGVGWIFVDRTPVRGPKSREAVKEAKRSRPRIGSKEASRPMPRPKAPPPRASDAESKPALRAAIAAATQEAVSPDGASDADDADDADTGEQGTRRRRRRRKAGGSASRSLPTVNTPLTFIKFVAEYQPGATVDGEVESFASHGAFVLVGDARCYLPLSAMGDPAPRSAREVMQKGERRTFVVQALDAPRRGVELALPGFEHLAGRPTDETVEAEIGEAPRAGDRPDSDGGEAPRPSRRRRKKADETPAPDESSEAGEPAPQQLPAKRARRMAKAVAREVVAPETVVEAPGHEAAPAAAVITKAAAKKAAAKKTAPKKAASAAPVKNAAAKKTAAKKAAPAEKAPAKKAAKKAASPEETTTARKGVLKKAAPAEKAPAKKATAKKTASPDKATALEKTAAEKTAAEKAPAKKAPAEKAPAEKAPAKRPAKKAPAEKAAAKRTPAKRTPAKKASGGPPHQ